MISGILPASVSPEEMWRAKEQETVCTAIPTLLLPLILDGQWTGREPVL